MHSCVSCPRDCTIDPVDASFLTVQKSFTSTPTLTTTPCTCMCVWWRLARDHAVVCCLRDTFLKLFLFVCYLDHLGEIVRLQTLLCFRLCAVCKRPFNDPTFVRYPNGVVTHVHCAKNKFICPVTGRLFSSGSTKS